MSTTPESPSPASHELPSYDSGHRVQVRDLSIVRRLVEEEYIKKGTFGLYSRWRVYDYATEPINPYGVAYNALGITSVDTVLDVGCAAGRGPISFIQDKGHAGLVIGVDIDTSFEDKTKDPERSMFAIAARINHILAVGGYRQVSYIAAMGENLPLANDSVDGAMTLFMLYHAVNPERVLQELQRVTKPMGRIVIATSGNDNKAREREFEPQIAAWLSKKLGTLVVPPQRFTENFDIRTAEEVLPRSFEILRIIEQRCKLRIQPGFSNLHYLASLGSRREHYSPVPSNKLWLSALKQVVVPELRKHYRELGGVFEDTVHRALFVCANRK